MKIKENLQKEYDDYVKTNSEDTYSKACVDCGEAFGNALDEGKTPDEAEKIMCDTPMGKELTGFMVGSIMSAIAHFHPRGEEVNSWWNKRFGGTGDEKGTINPAIVTIKE